MGAAYYLLGLLPLLLSYLSILLAGPFSLLVPFVLFCLLPFLNGLLPLGRSV